GTGALLLFGMVQVTMIGWGLFRGEKLRMGQWFAFGMAFAGLIYLVLPGLEAPDMTSSMLMVAAGLGWGVYSLLGRGAGDPISKTAGNFIRACLFGLLLALWSSFQNAWDWQGVGLAVGSGAIASGLGYALWYRVLPSMRAATAATVQLSVPVIAASGGILLLEERLTNRLLLASLTILGGIAWFIQQRKT
ncbi:MAG: DMT family transporter, partial [Acidobacteria bacterium]|nr:DMT family transporter [Acidobacteriota bacterium]